MGSNGRENAKDGVLHLYRRGRSPLYIQVELLIDEPDLGAEGRLPAERQVDYLLQKGNVVRAERMAAGLEHIERLTALEQNGLLRLVDNELGPRAQLIVGILPCENIRTSVVFDNRDNGHMAPFYYSCPA